MLVNAKITLGFDITQTVEAADSPYASGSTNKIVYSGLSETINLGGSSTPAISKFVAFKQALTAGAATIDLTACPGGPAGTTVNASGLKLIAYKFRGLKGNAAAIAIAVGGSNGYQIDGGAYHRTLAPGASDEGYNVAASAAIDGTHKTIDLTGTGTDVLEIEMVFGS